MRDEIKKFAGIMEEKLAAHDKEWNGNAWQRGGHPLIYMLRLNEKMGMLAAALRNGDLEDVQKECANVGNYAMMINDIIDIVKNATSCCGGCSSDATSCCGEGGDCGEKKDEDTIPEE